jgi:UDP:flavonoid glycosyltransferase YjiC (YdhE family)
MNSPEGLEWINNSKNSVQEGRNMKRMLDAYSKVMSADLLAICQNADVLISNLPTFGIVAAIAEKFHKAHWLILLSPLTPSSYSQNTIKPIIPHIKTPINRLSGYIGLYFTNWVSRQSTNVFREQLGLSTWTYRDYLREWTSVPVLYGVSQLVMPQDPRWHDKTFVTGYWIDPIPADYAPSPALAQFLADGDAPVYIGFGSMSSKDPQATTRLMLDALNKTRQRGIIYSGWAGLTADELPPSVFLLDGAPHEWLFPRMGAVIHHGGAGTTAAGLRAGVPSGVVAHMADQPYWGGRIHDMGVGAKPLMRHKLTSDNLAKMINTLVGSPNSPAIKEKATQLGAKLRAENGVQNAVHAISRIHAG